MPTTNNGKARCAHCAGLYPVEELKELEWWDGRKLPFCQSCRSHLEACGQCGKLHLTRDMRKVRLWNRATHSPGAMMHYCPGCFSALPLEVREMQECGHCHVIRIDPGDAMSFRPTANRMRVCIDCIVRDYSICDSCGLHDLTSHMREHTREEAGLYEEDNDQDPDERVVLCEQCERGSSVQSIIHQYNYKPTPIFHCAKKELGRNGTINPDDGSHLFMGVELEIDDGNNGARLVRKLQKTYPELLYCKHDGSLSEVGFEIVTHPLTLDFHKTEFPWETILKLCKEYKYKSHDASSSCGLHVHVNRSFFGALKKSCFLKLASFIHMHSTYIPRIAQRRSNGYSKFKVIRKVSHLYTLTGLRQSRDYGELNPERYDAVNFVNKTTLEFRVFKGSLGMTTVMSYLEFVHAVMNFVKGAPSTLILKNQASWKKFCQYILDNKKVYEYLPQYMKEKDCWKG